MTPKLSITGIRVKEGGMKGLEVSFCHQEEKDGKTWNIEDWQDRKMPVGEKLDEVIKAFRWYLMDIYGYDMESVNEADCKIKEVKFDGDIVISGELRVVNGSRTVNLKTCKVDDALEYEKIDELRKLVGQLKEEVALYMEGKSIMNDKQFVMTFYKDKKGFGEAEIAGMNEEQIKEHHTAALEKIGSIVIHRQEMSSDVIDNTPTVTLDDPREFKEPVTHIAAPNFDAAPVAEAKIISPNFGAEENPAELSNTDEEGEDSFMITPVQAIGQ